MALRSIQFILPLRYPLHPPRPLRVVRPLGWHAVRATERVDREQLEALRRSALRCFERHFAEPDCLSDPDKRRALFAARHRYQDATLALILYSRTVHRGERAF
jgi:hypothetical protein